MACGRINVGGGKNTKDATVTADKLLSGYSAYGATGKIEGSMPDNGAVSKALDTSTKSYTVPKGYHNGSGTVTLTTETKTVTPTASDQTISPSTGKVLSGVTVKGVSSSLPAAANILTGSKATVTSNGTTLASVEGSMPDNGAVTKSLGINESYTIPKGYHNGSGKVSQSVTTKAAATYAASTSDQTIAGGQYLNGDQIIKAVNITAPIADAILTGYNVSVSSNGTSLKSVSGAMPNNGSVAQTIAPTDAVQTYTVPKGYHSGSGKVTVSAIRGIETVKKLSNLYMGKGCNSPVCVQTGAYLIVDGGYGAGTTNVAFQEETLTRVSCPAASVQRWKQSGARVGDYAVFAGGSPLQQPQYANVDAYSSSLTKTICAELPEAKESTGAGSVGDYAIFAGGYKYNSSDPGNSYKYNSVTAYNKSLTKVAATALSWTGVTGGTQDANNQRAFFWNGTNVNCYDKSLTRTIPSGLGASRGDLSRGAALGSIVVITGGNNTADVYDIGLTRRSLTLSCKKEYCGATNLRDKFVLIAGGYDSAYMPNVDSIDPSLTVSRAQDLSTGRDFLGSGSIGRYALFMGGQTQGGNTQSAVEVYKLAVTA